MFIGEYKASVTAGKRIAIPKGFREVLGGGPLVVTKGYEDAIVLVKKENFMSLLEGVENIPFISSDKRETSRFLLSGAHEITPDAQGRFVVPESLVAHAGLTSSNAVFIGVGNWVEIWDQELWRKYQQRLKKESTQIADRLSSMSRSQA